MATPSCSREVSSLLMTGLMTDWYLRKRNLRRMVKIVKMIGNQCAATVVSMPVVKFSP